MVPTEPGSIPNVAASSRRFTATSKEALVEVLVAEVPAADELPVRPCPCRPFRRRVRKGRVRVDNSTEASGYAAASCRHTPAPGQSTIAP